MARIAVSRIPCGLHAARRDCDSYMEDRLLHVTVKVPLVRVQVLSYSADRNDHGRQVCPIPIHPARRGLGHATLRAHRRRQALVKRSDISSPFEGRDPLEDA